MGTGSLNAHWALHGAPKKNDFLNALKVKERDETALRRAREEIRAVLRAGLGNWETVIAKNELFEREFTRTSLRPKPTLRPKFKLQGSFVYATVNDPAQPKQRVDQDDGVYMPTDFIRIKSQNRPIVASKGYFRAVEAILAPLCRRRGWELDTSKASCVRVIISAGAHLDLPLYAIPSDQFEQLTETVAKSLGMDAARADSAGEDLTQEFYRLLPADQLMLAHRENGWHPSDPRKIEDWFQRAVDTYGYVLRRVCRYLKAWRDYQWQEYGLSSLAIMVCVVDIFDELGVEISENRDDLALLVVTERLADRLSRPIPNPVMNGDANVALDQNWTPEDRTMFVAKAKGLHQLLAGALHKTDQAANVLAQLQQALGNRVPRDESVIRWEQLEATVKSYPKTTVAVPPVVRRTTSG